MSELDPTIDENGEFVEEIDFVEYPSETEPAEEEPQIKRATITSLNKELQEYKDYVEEMFSNHKTAFDNLKSALEAHCWEPDAHHPAFLAKKWSERKK